MLVNFVSHCRGLGLFFFSDSGIVYNTFSILDESNYIMQFSLHKDNCLLLKARWHFKICDFTSCVSQGLSPT